jgi:hypothetical protein
MAAAVFKDAVNRLLDPGYVRQQAAMLPFYIELLRSAPPRIGGYEPRDLDAALATYALLRLAINTTDARFDASAAVKLESDFLFEYGRRQATLWEYLAQVGIRSVSPAGRIIETALISMMLFYAAANRVVKVIEMKWCVFPFCMARPA